MPPAKATKPKIQRGSPEAIFWVPEPRVILLGCTPFTRVEPTPCPTCHGLIGSIPDPCNIAKITYCARCDASTPQNDRQLARQRAATRRREAGHDRANQHASKLAKAKKEVRAAGVVLDERERRLIWNGYKGNIRFAREIQATAPNENRAKAGRDFLKAIKQPPDWSLVLDGDGKSIGKIIRDESGAVRGWLTHKELRDGVTALRAI